MRKLLIVNDFAGVRTLLKRYVLSELPDMVVEDSSSSEEALKKLEEERFDLVISGNKMRGLEGPALFQKAAKFNVNTDTPFIILTSSMSEEVLQGFAANGIEHYLVTPVSAKELAAKINTVSNPRSKRTHDRVSIPDAKVVLHADGGNIDGKTVNISSGGILCDLPYSVNHIAEITQKPKITIELPDEFANLEIKNIVCRFLHLNVLASNENQLPEQIRVGWQFLDISERKKKVFQKIFDQVKSEDDQLKKTAL